MAGEIVLRNANAEFPLAAAMPVDENVTFTLFSAGTYFANSLMVSSRRKRKAGFGVVLRVPLW